jgi:hypothetical protein
MTRRFIARLGVGVSVAAIVLSLSASAVLAGEITGNGKVLKVEDGGKWETGLHARSFCAYSGQEDNQFLDHEGDPLPEVTRGDPAHAQSWGQIPKVVRDEIAQFGAHPGQACNPNIGPPPEG